METHNDLEKKWEELKATAAAEIQDEKSLSIYYAQIYESLQGDGSQLKDISSYISEKILAKKPLSATEQLWLMMILGRLRDEKIAGMVAGKTKRGAPRKGQRSILVAYSVWCCIRDLKAMSVQHAWEMAAEEHHLDIVTVRKYWSKRKDLIVDSVSDSFPPFDHPDELIKSLLSRNKDYAKPIEF